MVKLYIICLKLPYHRFCYTNDVVARHIFVNVENIENAVVHGREFFKLCFVLYSKRAIFVDAHG